MKDRCGRYVDMESHVPKGWAHNICVSKTVHLFCSTAFKIQALTVTNSEGTSCSVYELVKNVKCWDGIIWRGKRDLH